MYNLAISMGLALVFFGLGWGVAGTWVAGFIPALLGQIIAYVFLARRTGKQLEAIMRRSMKEFEKGRLDSGRKALEKGFALERWQFLVSSQLHAQLGALEYMQRRWKPARTHLDQAWSRNWVAQGMLASLDHRERKSESALERLAKARGPGKKDATYWGLYAWIALESGDRERAMQILNDGVKVLSDSGALKGMLDAVRNRRKVKMKSFAPGWYQFFPEQMPKKAMQQSANARPGASWPQPRR